MFSRFRHAHFGDATPPFNAILVSRNFAKVTHPTSHDVTAQMTSVLIDFAIP